MNGLTAVDRCGLPWLLLAACTALLLPQLSCAGGWEARNAQGLTVRIVQDSYRIRDGYLLTRSYPDGAPDSGFGDQGVAIFSLGPDNEGPAVLKLDPLGRAWVAGASAGPADTLSAVVLRFLASGAADVSYADGGRSVSAPAGRRARALDLAPQADGSTFVAGFVLDAQGVERAGWWRLAPDGRVDTRFALGGLWVDEQPGSTEVRALLTGGDGSVALGLVRGDGAAAQSEIWVLAPGSASPRREALAAAPGKAGLVWAQGQWRWEVGAWSRAVADTVLPAVAPTPIAANASDRQPVAGTQQPGPATGVSQVQEPVAAGPAASVLVAAAPFVDTAPAWAWWSWGLGLLGLSVGVLVWLPFRRRLRKQA